MVGRPLPNPLIHEGQVVDNYLFKHEGGLISSSVLGRILRELGADQCDVLYIHTGVRIAQPAIGPIRCS